MTTYDLNNPLLIDTTLSDSWADLQLPTELLQQMKRESKSPSLILKDVNLSPVKPGEGSLKVCGDFDFTLFVVVNFEDRFTPSQFVKSLNESFNKFIPKHQLLSLQDSKIQINLMQGQTLFTPHSEILTLLVPDDLDTNTNLLTAKQVLYTNIYIYISHIFLLLQVVPKQYVTCVSDANLSRDEMTTWLMHKNLLGFRIPSNNAISTPSKTVLNRACDDIGKKIIIIQSSFKIFHPIKMHDLYYNHFYIDDPINAIFQQHVCRQVYEYLIELPFVTFFHLENFIAMDEDFLGWKFPKKLQEAFNFQLCLDPFFQDYFSPTKQVHPTKDFYLSATDLQQIQRMHQFLPSTMLVNHLWLSFKHNPLQHQLFPFLMVHAGSLFTHNFIPTNAQNNYFKSSIAGTLQLNLGHFDITFNPSIYIRHFDTLTVPQRFFVQDRAGRIIRFDPNSSHVWFEINFY